VISSPPPPSLSLNSLLHPSNITKRTVPILFANRRRFVQFGLVNRLLRQLSRYPLRDLDAPFDPASDPALPAVARYGAGGDSWRPMACAIGAETLPRCGVAWRGVAWCAVLYCAAVVLCLPRCGIVLVCAVRCYDVLYFAVLCIYWW